MKRLAIALALALASTAQAAVTLRTEDLTLKVSPTTRKTPKFPPIEKLKGKTQYTTRALILENEHLALTILPEFAGRITHVIHKPTGKECFWVNDEIVDDVSWSLGGMRASFPFWEHGRHFDETAGHAAVHHKDGAVTIALDTRFNDFLKLSETTRYGRATPLRLAQYITIRPNESRFEWTVKVDNPMPLPCGFKLWTLFRQPSTRGIQVILPTAYATGHGANALEKWDPDTTVGDLQFSKFAVGMQHDFSGWYLPADDLNVLVVRDHKTAPGCKQVLYPSPKDAAGKGYIEMWIGNHEVFEEPGRLLPPLASYEISHTIHIAQGKGKAVYADRAGAYNAAEAAAKKLTLDLGPRPDAAFALLQQRIASKMPGGEGLYAECMDLVTETQMNLVRYAPKAEKILKESDDPAEILPAARRLLRVRKDSPDVLAGLDRVLARDARNPYANLYKAIWLLEAGKPAEAAGLLQPLTLPEALYLRNLLTPGEALQPRSPDVLPLGPDAETLEPLRQKGAAASSSSPFHILYTHRAQAKPVFTNAGMTSADHALIDLSRDPALIEFYLLRDNAPPGTLRTLNPTGFRAAESHLDALKAARFPGIPRPEK